MLSPAQTHRRPVESFLKRDDSTGRRRGQRKGHLRVHNGSWLLTYRVYDQAGRAQRETVTIGPGDGPGRLTEKQAERFAWDHYLSKVDQFSQQPRSLMSIGEFWTKHYEPGAKLKLKKTTREQYFSLYKSWIKPHLERKRLATLETGDVEMVITRAMDGGMSTCTVKAIRKVISAIFTKAKKLKIASGDNPASLADTPEVMAVRPKLALSAKQMHAVIEGLEEPVRTLALTAVLTSMNISELCGLQWKHINLTPEWAILDGEGLKPFTISVRQHFSRGEYGSLKTSSRKRDIPIPPALVAVLARLKARPKFSAPEDTVFCGGTGRPISENNTRKRKLAPIAKALGITRLSWHVFRYSHATFTEAAGMPAHDRQALMGHGAMDQTDRYTMEDQERVRGGLENIALMILKPQGKVQ